MYVSIDIETTGLNRQKDQILEFAAVAWNRESVMECSCFQRYVYWERLSGAPYALILNSKWFDEWTRAAEELSDNEQLPSNWCWPKDLGCQFREWLINTGINKAFPVGKNYQGFDAQFLERMPNWPKEFFKHRALDVGTLAATRLGIPSLFEIKINDSVAEQLRASGGEHTALYDARYALQVAIERVPRPKSA